jgi:retron-type reverse transcriptase
MLFQLKAADTLDKFAAAIGYSSSGLSFILYKMTDATKYQTFAIPKASGGTRTIHAPSEKLKRLQTRLARAILECNTEIHAKKPLPPLSHGFEKGRSIFTNAWEHKNRRFVLNIDVENFFPTINFGRVRGFFMRNRNYELPAKAATLIAQIACFQGKLPQGSPCSPIIANLIAHLLDVRMVRLAKAYSCSYSRYADDLTFSTNQKRFPAAIAEELAEYPGSWVLSDTLLNEIARTGFSVNHQKTRMQCRPSQQLVTGLTVNEKVNIRADYYRKARKMCSSLFNHGHYYTELAVSPALAVVVPGAAAAAAAASAVPVPKLIKSTATLEGVLSHIYYIKHRQMVTSEPDEEVRKAKANNKIKYPAYRNLYKKLLYFRHFINLSAPLIMCEGKTDNIYLRSALKGLSPAYPQLAEVKDGKLYAKVRFLKHSRVEHDILELSGGSGKIASFIARYNAAVFKNYKYRPMKFPVIILVDNDSGQAGKGGVFVQANKFLKLPVNFASTNHFYHLCHNLYLIKTPELGGAGESCMEDLFDASVRAETVDGKTFNPKDDKDTVTQYSKIVFADKVVRAKYATINFSQFTVIFDRILAVLAHYSANKPSSATPSV